MEEVTVHNKNEVSVFFTKIPGSPPNQILLLSVGLQYFSQGLPQAPDSRHVDECSLEPLAYHLLHYSPHQREYRRRWGTDEDRQTQLGRSGRQWEHWPFGSCGTSCPWGRKHQSIFANSRPCHHVTCRTCPTHSLQVMYNVNFFKSSFWLFSFSKGNLNWLVCFKTLWAAELKLRSSLQSHRLPPTWRRLFQHWTTPTGQRTSRTVPRSIKSSRKRPFWR